MNSQILGVDFPFHQTKELSNRNNLVEKKIATGLRNVKIDRRNWIVIFKEGWAISSGG